MAKKSTATRQANAARRSQTTAKAPAVALVRAPKETNGTGDTGKSLATAAPAPSAKAAPPARSMVVTPRAERPRAPAVSKAPQPAPKPEPAARQESARTQATRVARARATQRARTANLISPEHYGYVIKDLKLIAALAVTMFAIIIVLHFVVPQ